jgi:phage tail sheath gpL-like
MSQSTINIPGYSLQNRVPGVFAIVDASQANTGQFNQLTLLIGQITSAETAVPGQAVISAGVGEAISSYGAGSQLAIAVERYRALDPFGTVYCLPLTDASGAVAATATIALTGTATAAGSIPLYIDGNNINVSVNLGDTATAIATNMAAAINAFTTPGGNPLSMTAAAASGTVTVTQRNKGTLGNESVILLSFLGVGAGQGQPGTTNVAGVTATITGFASGAGDPTIANALANLPATSYDFIWCPYHDATSLGAISSFLGESAGRWNWTSELFGVAFTAFNGTFGARTTWGQEQNDQFLTAIGAYGSPNPDWHWSIDYCAAAAVSIRSNPSVPVGGLAGGVALNVRAPATANLDSFEEQDSLLYDGVSTYVSTQSGQVLVSRAITTYQQSSAGVPNDAYLSLNVPYQLMAYIRAVRSMIQSQFNQCILVADGTKIPAGSAMVTSQTILYSIVALYQQQCTTGLVQNATAFAAQATAQNAGGGLVTALLPVQLGNQLINVALDVRFTQP